MAVSQKQLDEFVNERVGENFRILPGVLEELKKERDQLLLAVNKHVESNIRASVTSFALSLSIAVWWW